jgi:predicted nucleotidyltransferase
VKGFKEVAEVGTAEMQLDEGSYRIATLPGIILLKLISFDERPEKRYHDPADIAQIISSYYKFDEGLFMDKYYDLLERLDNGHDIIAARAIGRLMQPILAINTNLKSRILQILTNHIANNDKSYFVELFTREIKGTIEHTANILQEIVEGINDAELPEV